MHRAIKCPTCAHTATHVKNAETYIHNTKRDLELMINAICEDGHSFTIGILQHKGETVVEVAP